MDFLRRLAPPAATDPTRAVVALPSRFEAEAPLRLTTGRSEAAREELTDSGSEGLAIRNGPGGSDPRRARGEDANGPGRELPQWKSADKATVTSSATRHPQRPARESASAQLASIDNGTPAERRGGVDAEALSAIGPGARPLTDATVAQRSNAARDDGPVVNVTIGRIDVVAAPAPRSPAGRKTARREGSVPLADFLRGSNGSRR